jgi:hypothetical protein
MRKFIVLMLVLAAGVTVPVAKAEQPAFGVWHRLSEDQSNPAPEHQRLTCLEAVSWACVYDKIPEPSLNFFWDGDTGYFLGRTLTAADRWTCPTWFPAAACQDVTKVIRGSELYVNAGGVTFLVGEDFVITGTGANAVLWLEFTHWQGPQFVCPWYRTFDQALAADPFPLPFNGTDWPAQTCVVNT